MTDSPSMKSFVVIISLVLLSAVWTLAQETAKNGLAVSGSVVKISSECIEGKPVPQITVYMQFRNDGNVPLILIIPQMPFERRVWFISEGSEDSTGNRIAGDSLNYNPYLDNPFGSPTIDDYDPMPRYVESLKKSKKPLKQIEPGGYYEFQDVLWVKNGFKFRPNPLNDKGECAPGKDTPIPVHSFFTVEYHLSVSKYDGGTELLRTLQQRWKPFGHLPLDDKGNISYKSEKILLNAQSK